VYSVTGPVVVQQGKDLSSVTAIIGPGGPLVHASDPRAALEAALADSNDPESLRPKSPRLLLDRYYLLYACGLLASVEPKAALEVALDNLQPIGRTPSVESRLTV